MLGRVDFWVGLVAGVALYYAWLWYRARKTQAAQ